VRVRVSVGEVDIRLEGVDISVRQVRGLAQLAAALSTVISGSGAEEEGEAQEARAPVGFAAHLERLPEEIPQEDLSWYFDERATGGHGKA
jgi:hypothetical protein